MNLRDAAELWLEQARPKLEALSSPEVPPGYMAGFVARNEALVLDLMVQRLQRDPQRLAKLDRMLDDLARRLVDALTEQVSAEQAGSPNAEIQKRIGQMRPGPVQRQALEQVRAKAPRLGAAPEPKTEPTPAPEPKTPPRRKRRQITELKAEAEAEAMEERDRADEARAYRQEAVIEARQELRLKGAAMAPYLKMGYKPLRDRAGLVKGQPLIYIGVDAEQPGAPYVGIPVTFMKQSETANRLIWARRQDGEKLPVSGFPDQFLVNPADLHGPWVLAGHELSWSVEEKRYLDGDLALVLENRAGSNVVAVPADRWAGKHAWVEHCMADREHAAHIMDELRRRYPGVRVGVKLRPPRKLEAQHQYQDALQKARELAHFDGMSSSLELLPIERLQRAREEYVRAATLAEQMGKPELVQQNRDAVDRLDAQIAIAENENTAPPPAPVAASPICTLRAKNGRPIEVYVGQTRSKDLIERLASYGWGEATQLDEWPPRRTPYFLDNMAFKRWEAAKAQNKEFTGYDFNATTLALWMNRIRLIERRAEAGELALPAFIVLPDVPARGDDSLALSLSYFDGMFAPDRGYPAPVYLVVQDGMTFGQIGEVLKERPGIAGLFVGGTLEWKKETMKGWADLAHAYGRRCHVGRAGNACCLELAIEAGVDSIDTSLPLWSEENLERFRSAICGERAEAREAREVTG